MQAAPPAAAPQLDLPVTTVAPPVPAEPPPAPITPELALELELSQTEAGGGGGTRPTASEIARTLQEVAELLQLTNANTFKVRAYENAARALSGIGEDFDAMLAAGTLDEIPGVGSSIAEKVATLATTGRLPYLDELRSQVPSGLLALLRIPGLGPKKAQALNSGLGIHTVEELEVACREGRLADLRGFGEKTAQNILLGIEQLRRIQGKFLWSHAHAVVEPVIEELRRHPKVQRLEFAGSLRRRKETVHDVDIVLATDAAEDVMNVFASGPWAERLLGRGETKTSVIHPIGLQMDLRAVTDAQYPYALHHFTGSKEHNIAMRGRAVRMGIKMNEYGLFRGEELIPCRDEAEIFAAVGLEFVPPEMREDQGEIEAALHGGVPKNLLALSDLKGALHVHTTASDGRDSLESLVTGAVALGWQYIGISDHAAGSLRPTGLDAAKLAAQRREIEQLRRRLPQIGILHGIEVEVLADGRLDADDGMLAECDFVIAAFHAGFQLSREDQTRRLLGAIDHPRTTILGHPTSRILLHRRGIEADWQVIFEAAARHGVVVEIDSHPQRMDLDGMGARAARDKGALLCISPDAHDVAGLAAVRYGVGLARRGWIGPQDVLNTQSFEAVQARLRQHHGSAAPHP